jgi:hypothetical protein
MTTWALWALPLATTPPNPADVKQGTWGLVLFLGLAVAVVLLWLSFRKQLGKIDFEEEPDKPAKPADDVAEPAKPSSEPSSDGSGAGTSSSSPS